MRETISVGRQGSRESCHAYFSPAADTGARLVGTPPHRARGHSNHLPMHRPWKPCAHTGRHVASPRPAPSLRRGVAVAARARPHVDQVTGLDARPQQRRRLVLHEPVDAAASGRAAARSATLGRPRGAVVHEVLEQAWRSHGPPE